MVGDYKLESSSVLKSLVIMIGKYLQHTAKGPRLRLGVVDVVELHALRGGERPLGAHARFVDLHTEPE